MSAVQRLVAAVIRRQRVADAAWGLSRIALPTGLVLAAVGLVLVHGCIVPRAALWLVATPVPLILVWAAARRHPARAVARRIDAHYDTHDLLGSALELQRAAAIERSKAGRGERADTIVALLVERASQRAAGLQAAPVVRVTVASPRWWDALALVLFVAALVTPLRYLPFSYAWSECADSTATFVDPTPIVIEATPNTDGPRPIDMPEAGPLRDNLRDLADDEDDVAAKIARQVLELLDQLEKGEIDRAAALEELQRLEELLAKAEGEFEAQLEEDPATLADALRDLSEAFQSQELTEEVAAALAAQEGEEAEKALNEAGEQAAENGGDDDEQLHKALEEAERKLAKAAEQSRKTDAELDEEERRLRREEKKKPETPEEQAEHERRLQQQKDRVEQLERQQEREQAAQKRLEQLRRDAKEAQKNRGNAEKRQRSLEKLSRGMKQAAQTAKQSRRMSQARDGMQEAKSMVRRAGASGEGQKRRKEQFRKFSQAAGGQQGKQGKDGKGKDGKDQAGAMGPDGKDGKGKGQPTLLIEGDVGQGEPNMMMEGEGQGEGQGEGEGEGEGQGEGQGEGEGEGQGQGEGQGESGSPSPGDGIGQGSVEPLAPDGTGLESNKKNVRVKVREGKGATRAEVIRDASQQGFATEAYRRVFQDYRGFAQSALDSEALPAAQRRRVKRYYQLITPRE